jgi:hypothetical protein
MIYKLKQFFKRIYNLYRWFPIIWKDQDWDDHFIFEILKFKLKNQAKYIGYHDRHMSAKRDAEIMMLCVRLIENIQDEYYGREYQDYHKSELKFINSESHPGMYEMEIEHISDNYDDYFKKYPRIYKQVKTEDKHQTAFDVAKVNEERAHKLLFKILEQNIRRWWD